MASHSVNRRGIFAMVGAMACFSANDAGTKLATAWLPPSEIVALRGLFALLIALAIIVVRAELDRIGGMRSPVVIIRAAVETLTGFVIITALALMPLANVTAILLIQPVILSVAAGLIFKERVGWQRWAAVVAGLIGMLLVVRPGAAGFDSSALLVLLAAFLSVTRDLLTRRIDRGIPTSVIVVATAFLGAVLGPLGALAGSWVTPSLPALGVILIAAAFLVGAFTLAVIAFRGTDVSVISPFRYAIVLFAVIYGVVLFGEIPDLVSMAGMGIIVVAGLYTLHRETAQQRRRRRAEIEALERSSSEGLI